MGPSGAPLHEGADFISQGVDAVVLDRTKDLDQQNQTAERAAVETLVQPKKVSPLQKLRDYWQYFVGQGSSSLTRRIVFLNVAGLFALFIGILYLSQSRAFFIE